MAGRTGLYPGSFDPVTYGHVDLIRRSLSLVDRLVVAVLPNAGKAALLPLPEREALLRFFKRHGEAGLHSAQALSREFQSAYEDIQDLVLLRASAAALANATSPATYSGLPRASWFHTSTIAMHGAMPRAIGSEAEHRAHREQSTAMILGFQ